MKTNHITTETDQAPAETLTARQITRRMIEAAKAKNGGKLSGKGDVDPRKFRRL